NEEIQRLADRLAIRCLDIRSATAPATNLDQALGAENPERLADGGAADLVKNHEVSFRRQRFTDRHASLDDLLFENFRKFKRADAALHLRRRRRFPRLVFWSHVHSK